MILSKDVVEVLAESVVTGNTMKLQGQLDRKLYMAVAKAIEAMGGRWDRRASMHVFDEDAELVVADAVATGRVVSQRDDFDFYPTSPGVAASAVEAACIHPGDKLLEPSAGDGALIKAALDYDVGAAGVVHITAWEIDPKNAAVLRKRFGDRILLHEGDFLTSPAEESYDVILANPPFSRSRDIIHVTAMMERLKPGGRLVTIMSPGWTFRGDRRARAFREMLDGDIDSWTWSELPEGSFKSAGTMVRTGILSVIK